MRYMCCFPVKYVKEKAFMNDITLNETVLHQNTTTKYDVHVL